MYERIARSLYARLDIRYPHELDIDMIAEHLGVNIVRYPGASLLYGDIIALDARLPPDEQRMDFFHEAAHVLLHNQNQLLIPDLAIQYQEAKADLLALHLAAPDYMLLDAVEPDKPYMDQAPCLARIFHLPLSVMLFRLGHFYRTIEKKRLRVV